MSVVDRLAEKWYDASGYTEERYQARWWLNAIAEEVATKGGEDNGSTLWLRQNYDWPNQFAKWLREQAREE